MFFDREQMLAKAADLAAQGVFIGTSSWNYIEGLAAQVPSDFQFGLKVTDEITVRKFPNLP